MSWEHRRLQFELDPSLRLAECILLLIATGALAVAATTIPGLGRELMDALRALGRTDTQDRVNRATRGLVHRQMLKIHRSQLSLGVRGRRRVSPLLIKHLILPPRPTRWDGQWRLVCFDVPEELRAFRGVFRRTLKTLGFVFVQQSVWIYPFPCEAALETLAEQLGLTRHITVVVASNVSGDTRFRRRFTI